MQSELLVPLDTDGAASPRSRQLAQAHAGLSERVKVRQSSPDRDRGRRSRRRCPEPAQTSSSSSTTRWTGISLWTPWRSRLTWPEGCVVVADNALCFDGGR